MRSLANEIDRQEVLQRLSKLTANATRRWGRMNPHQMICHLNDSFKVATGEKVAGSSSNFFTRSIVKWVGLYAPLPWPKGVPTRPEMDQQSGGTPPLEWDKDLYALDLMVRRFSHEPRDFAWQPHPLFGTMPTSAWLRFGYLHLDHHLRQFGL